MPSKSGKQHRLMALVANDPKAAKRLGISQKVGEDFMKADKGRKFGSGGSMKESKAMMKKEVSFMKKKGAPKSMIRHEEAEYGMKKGVKKMQMGGMSGGSGAPLPATPGAAPVAATGFTGGIGSMADALTSGLRAAEGRPRIQSGGMGMRRMAGGGSTGGSYRKAADGIASKGKTKGHVVKMREGGSVGGSYRKAADGIASKGKTKGKIVRMNYGGKC